MFYNYGNSDNIKSIKLNWYEKHEMIIAALMHTYFQQWWEYSPKSNFSHFDTLKMIKSIKLIGLILFSNVFVVFESSLINWVTYYKTAIKETIVVWLKAKDGPEINL